MFRSTVRAVGPVVGIACSIALLSAAPAVATEFCLQSPHVDAAWRVRVDCHPKHQERAGCLFSAYSTTTNEWKSRMHYYRAKAFEPRAIWRGSVLTLAALSGHAADTLTFYRITFGREGEVTTVTGGADSNADWSPTLSRRCLSSPSHRPVVRPPNQRRFRTRFRTL